MLTAVCHISPLWSFLNHYGTLCQCQGSWKFYKQECWSIPHTSQCAEYNVDQNHEQFYSVTLTPKGKLRTKMSSPPLHWKSSNTVHWPWLGGPNPQCVSLHSGAFHTCPSATQSVDSSKNHGLSPNGNKQVPSFHPTVITWQFEPVTIRLTVSNTLFQFIWNKRSRLGTC